MAAFPVFLSVVFIVRNQAGFIEKMLSGATDSVSGLVSDYELIVIDNASNDDSISVIKNLIERGGHANVQVYALTKEVDADTASWVGVENALGDFVAVIDPLLDDIGFLPELLDKAVNGADVVFASNQEKPVQSLAYRSAYAVFNKAYEWLIGINLARDVPPYRVLSKRIVNFILQHPNPAITYRYLPATGSFARVNLSYSAKPQDMRTKRLGESIERGMRLLISTTRVPMRLVTSLSLFGAVINLVYSMYVVAIWLFKDDVAPGWVSLSLQQSGMFFLISLVLLVLGEYILNMARLSSEGPPYHIAQEFTSARMTRRERLNVELLTPDNAKETATSNLKKS